VLSDLKARTRLLKRAYLAGLALHFWVIIAVCSRDTFCLLGEGLTVSPHLFDPYWRLAEAWSSAALGEHLATGNPVRQALAAYAHSAGIESSYGFFAPNVPDTFKVVFELRYADGRIEYALPSVNEASAGERLTNLFDQIANTRFNALREVMLRTLADSVWQEHPEAQNIRAVFGVLKQPSPVDFHQGKTGSFEFLYAYDYTFHPSPQRDEDPACDTNR
jgi:hypothetical protein